MTKVIHIKDVPKNWTNNTDYVYIGRSGKGNTSIFGNQHKVGWCNLCNNEHAQGRAVEAFAKDFERRILEDDEFRKAVFGLRGKTLVCFCKPKRCHGDVYVEFLERQDENNS